MTARTLLAAGVVVGTVVPVVAAPRGQATTLTVQTASESAPHGTTAEGATSVSVDESLRYPIQQMDGVLVQAVKQGAQNLANELSALVPDLRMFTGSATAHGFPDIGYGVTFVVEIPIINTVTIQLFGQLSQMPPVGSGTVRPASVSKVEAAQSELLNDPNTAYQIRVREALMDAMLDYGGTIPLKSDEWLTVTARSIDTSFSVDERISILRIKGGDLAAFKAGKLTREQARKKVQLIEF